MLCLICSTTVIKIEVKSLGLGIFENHYYHYFFKDRDKVGSELNSPCLPRYYRCAPSFLDGFKYFVFNLSFLLDNFLNILFSEFLMYVCVHAHTWGGGGGGGGGGDESFGGLLNCVGSLCCLLRVVSV